MKIGMIGAMEEELLLLQETLTDVTVHHHGGADFICGTYKNCEIIAVRSGIGKVLAALTATLLIDHYHVDYLINTGSAGGIGHGLHVGDVVISEKLAYHDVDVTAFDYEKGQMAGMPLYYEADHTLIEAAKTAAQQMDVTTHCGLIVSGDQFVHSQNEIKRIQSWFPDVLANEMEGTAIAQVAYQFKVPFVVIRAMSDVGDEEASVSFDEFIIEAGRRSCHMTLKLIDQLCGEA